jgi:hypothetical protein
MNKRHETIAAALLVFKHAFESQEVDVPVVRQNIFLSNRSGSFEKKPIG